MRCWKTFSISAGQLVSFRKPMPTRKPTQRLETRVRELERKWKTLDGVIDALQNLDAKTIGMTILVEAKCLALHSLVKELAQQQGISSETFNSHFEKRVAFWHDYLLRKIEDLVPGLAAAADSRLAVDPDIETQDPPLFG